MRRLIIHKLKADDDGVYLCEMRGRVRTVANVTVKGQLASGRRLRLVVSLVPGLTDSHPCLRTHPEALTPEA